MLSDLDMESVRALESAGELGFERMIGEIELDGG